MNASEIDERAARKIKVARPVVSWAVAIVTLAVTLAEWSDLVAREMREFRPESQRGGMAEWSMAVVLKTTEPVRGSGGFESLLRPPTTASRDRVVP